jgi:predicted enzyme related to lactoylglutathione lyase
MIQLRVCVDVDDLDRAITFYQRALGLTLGRRFGPHWAEMLGATSPIDLLAEQAGSQATAAGPALRDYSRHWTPVHLDLVVENLERAVDRALSAGAVLERDIQARPWGRIAVLADPFGHGLCLLEMRGRGYDEMIAPRQPSPERIA